MGSITPFGTTEPILEFANLYYLDLIDETLIPGSKCKRERLDSGTLGNTVVPELMGKCLLESIEGFGSFFEFFFEGNYFCVVQLF